MYTFDNDLVSDLHKEAYGFRPSPDFWDMWKNGLTDEGRQAEWDYLLAKADSRALREALEEKADLEEFEDGLKKIMETGKGYSEINALLFMTPIEWEENEYLNSQDIEHWVWERGILFTERGREIVEMLKQAYEVK